jgi:DNA processing protein
VTQQRDAQAAVIALARRIGVHEPGLAERLEILGPQQALAHALEADATLFPDDPEPLLADARADLQLWRERGVRLLSVLDPGYPANLHAVHDRPALLFVAGELIVDDQRAIAVVGARDASDSQRDAAAKIARDLVNGGHTVVSGLAAGIDTAAHRAAIAHGGRTVAVIGGGLIAPAYPRENASLQRELAHAHAVLSPCWPETPAGADGFRRRNAVMSGLSRGSVIVAAGPRSGTRILARRALAHGRPVFLLPELLVQPWAVELAGRPNVHVVSSADEVVAVTDRLAEPLRDG